MNIQDNGNGLDIHFRGQPFYYWDDFYAWQVHGGEGQIPTWLFIRLNNKHVHVDYSYINPNEKHANLWCYEMLFSVELIISQVVSKLMCVK